MTLVLACLLVLLAVDSALLRRELRRAWDAQGRASRVCSHLRSQLDRVQDERDAAVATIEAAASAAADLPCGHPAGSVSPGPTTRYCRWCAVESQLDSWKAMAHRHHDEHQLALAALANLPSPTPTGQREWKPGDRVVANWNRQLSGEVLALRPAEPPFVMVTRRDPGVRVKWDPSEPPRHEPDWVMASELLPDQSSVEPSACVRCGFSHCSNAGTEYAFQRPCRWNQQ